MDVVKTNIEKIGGTVDVHSQPGQGTTLKIKIPLTLAIIPALIVTSGGDRYAIPQVSLLELVRLEGEQARKGIEMIHGAPVYRLRGNLLPLVYLNRELEIEDSSKAPEQDIFNIVVLQADDRQFGLVVDQINDTEEIVVKPLGKQLKGISGVCRRHHHGRRPGCSHSGRARYCPACRSGHGGSRSQSGRQGREGRARDGNRADVPAVSTWQKPPHGHPALAWWHGWRKSRQPAWSGRTIARLCNTATIFCRSFAWRTFCTAATNKTADQQTLQVVVQTDGDRSAGFVVGRILDIVEATLDVKRTTKRDGLLGSAVIQGHVTDLVDLPAILRKEEPAFFEQAMAVG